jgi:hypothetical protein
VLASAFFSPRQWVRRGHSSADGRLLSRWRTGHDGLNNALLLKQLSNACNLILQVKRARQRDDKS